jgi:Protein of unknown function (DUF1569)
MPTTATRRPLTFDTLDRVMPDVDRLMAGHTTVGNWTLGQICNHLTIGLIGSIDGMDLRVPWVLRKLVAPLVLRRILSAGSMGEGVKVPPALLPKSEVDDRAEVEALRAALQMFAAHSGPMAAHPFFGTLTRVQHERLSCIHCAHHLSFAIPTTGTHS